MASELENWSLEKWLKKLGLRSKYKQAFIDNGYETADLCADLKKEDLDVIEVTNKHHRSTLFTQSRKLLELLNKEGLTASVEASLEPPAKASAQTTLPKNLSLRPVHIPTSPAPHAAALPDYSEPWSSNSGPPVPTSPTSRNSLFLKSATGTPGEGDSTDGLSPVRHKGSNGHAVPNMANRRKPPMSPGTELPAYKREGSGTGLTLLQLKLKIREELFLRGVVLSEPPYCDEVSCEAG